MLVLLFFLFLYAPMKTGCGNNDTSMFGEYLIEVKDIQERKWAKSFALFSGLLDELKFTLEEASSVVCTGEAPGDHVNLERQGR